ncbi:MAG: rod shape-determining protein MreC, partial [Planktomarina sp.]
MARDQKHPDKYSTAFGRLIIGVLVFLLLATFLLWRIDSPRVERVRMEILDRVIPSFSWASAPITATVELVRSARSYSRIYQQNQ